MTRARKMAQLFTVRNASGQYVGSYRAMTAEQAIQAFKRDQMALVSTFRSCSVKLDGHTAKVEG